MSPPLIRRRLGALAVGVLAAVGVSFMAAAPASAATSYGYVRLAHLSPDSPDVDVYLSSVTGGMKTQVFRGVGYGVVSAYQTLPVGTYAVAMRLAKADPAKVKAFLSTEVVVSAGRAYTVAGVGPHAALGLKVIHDDLGLPGSGKAKIRIIQASIKSPLLNVSLDGGTPIASAVAFATTTTYRTVTPGDWTVSVQPVDGTAATTLSAKVGAGDVYSLLILDGKNGLTAELRPDAERQGQLPGGGVPTGVGGTAPLSGVPVVLIGSVLVLFAAGLVGLRLRRARARRM